MKKSFPRTLDASHRTTFGTIDRVTISEPADFIASLKPSHSRALRQVKRGTAQWSIRLAIWSILVASGCLAIASPTPTNGNLACPSDSDFEPSPALTADAQADAKGARKAGNASESPRPKSVDQPIEVKATSPRAGGILERRTTLRPRSAGSVGVSTTASTTTRNSGHTYYIASKSTSGSGTVSDPFGMPDLLDTTTMSRVAQGQALKVLQPGDTLYFRGGTYTVRGSANGNYWLNQLICPTVSGTASSPITIASYPGETVTFKMSAGAQPLFGTSLPTLNYVRFVGFTILPVTGDHAMALAGTGNEVACMKITGATNLSDTDNYEGIWLQNANSSWIHHNDVSGFINGSQNGAGLKVYASTNVIAEDNYFHGNSVGIFDKDGGGSGSSQVALSDNTYRRNYLTANTINQFLGNNQYGPSTLHIYDNVVDGDINLNVRSQNDEVYNNLLRTICRNDGMIIGIYGNTSAPAKSVYRQNVWNNIILTGGSSFRGFWNPNTAFSVGGPNSPLTYMDYNVYDGEPIYDFGAYLRVASSFSLGEFRSKGFETHSSMNVPPSNLFLDQTSYALKSPWTTAGRYGDPVGPRFPVAQILDTRRYGPGAGAQAESATTIVKQPQDQVVQIGGTATFSVQVNGPTVAFRWQKSRDRGRNWTLIPGATAASYTTARSRTTDHGTLYRVLVNHKGGMILSDKATLTIKRKPTGKQ